MSVSIYAHLACAEYGHIRTGVSNTTDLRDTVWSDQCSRCQADLQKIITERSAASESR